MAMDYSLSTGMQFINSLKPQKTQLLCERIILGMIESKPHTQIFNEAEMAQLCAIFALDTNALLLTIDTLIYIYRQCAFIRIPRKILPFFQEIGLDEAHVFSVSPSQYRWKA